MVSEQVYTLTEHRGSEGLSGSANLSNLSACRFIKLTTQVRESQEINI